MKLLLIHSDYIEYEVTKDTKVAEKIDPENRKGSMDEVLVVFVAVETKDESDPKSVIDRATHEIEGVLGQINTSKVVLYPYAHLSSDLSSPAGAIEILKGVENKLKSKYEAMRAPFGYYKSFKISCKGHPLSELSRDIDIQKKEKVSKALAQEDKIKSYWYILTPGGKLTSVDDFGFSGKKKLRKFAKYETEKVRKVEREPPHVKLMKRLKIADYEEASDSGNIRFYPSGTLIKHLLEEYVTKKTIDYGAMEVETPIMYDMEHPTLKSYLNRFPARQYIIESEKKKFFLRFAACFGSFLQLKDATLSYRMLPLKIYELTRYSFRREKRGELTGLRRLRSFSMPDMHTLCDDINMAIDEFEKQYRFCMNTLEDIGLGINDYEVAIRFTKDFYEKNKDFVVSLAKIINKPVLIEMWDEKIFYFILKFEFNFVDALGKASALSTVQIDVENANRYGIEYDDDKGIKKNPIILHCSPSGAIERCIYALLEKEYMDSNKSKPPMFPVWLSPTQVRFIPVSGDQLNYCKNLVKEMKNEKIRVDLDDRDISLGKKIREAEKDWIPYVVVVGKKELETDKLSVRLRSCREQKKYLFEEFIKIVKEKISNKITYPLGTPMLLSKKPIFGG